MIISGLSAAFFVLRVMDEDGKSASGFAIALAVATGLVVGSGMHTDAKGTLDRAATHVSKLADTVASTSSQTGVELPR